MADPGGKIKTSHNKLPEGQQPFSGGKKMSYGKSYGKKSMKKSNPGSHKGGKYGY